MEASVGEIHRHPLRPPEFAEPLFLGREDKKEIAEHLARSSSWLANAGDAASDDVGAMNTEQIARPYYPCHVYRGAGGEAWFVRPGCSRRKKRTEKRRVARVIERWRDVHSWWEPEGGVDRLFFRVLLSGGVVADLALDRRYGWCLERVLD